MTFSRFVYLRYQSLTKGYPIQCPLRHFQPRKSSAKGRVTYLRRGLALRTRDGDRHRQSICNVDCTTDISVIISRVSTSHTAGKNATQ